MGFRESVRIFSFLCLFVAGTYGGSYLLTAPYKVQPGSVFDVSVAILNTTENVKVEAILQNWRWNGTIRDYDVIPIFRVEGYFNRDTPGTLSSPVEPDLICSDCRLLVRGTGGLVFERTIHMSLSRTVVILVQTDKAIYRPSQTVNFRAFAVYPDLTMYTGLLDLVIKDPMNNKIKLFSNLASPSGVVSGSFDLSDQPEFGTWSIDVSLHESSDRTTQSFEVADYELPRFEVTVKLPPFGLTNMASLTGSVEAEYTFGQPVKGMVELHLGPNQGADRCGVSPRTTQISFEIDGTADFTVPLEDISRAVAIYDLTQVRVTAFVKEAATGVRLNGSEIVTFYAKESSVTFLENTPSVFKPGLPYTAFIQVTTPDGLSPPNAPLKDLSVYTTVTYDAKVPDQHLYSTNTFTGSYPLPGQNVSLPADGVVPFNIDIPGNATRITIKATYDGVSETRNIEKTYSKSNNYIQMSLLDNNIKSGSTVTVKIDGTELLNELTYEVISRGSKVAAGFINGNGQKSMTFDLQVTPEMAPTSRLLTFYVRGDDEIVADSLAFNVEGLFHNEVSITFSKNESEPGKSLDVLLTADPYSEVSILAVDQSVLLLKSGNDITPEKVGDALSTFETGGDKPSGSDYALSYSAESTKEVFESTGLQIITDVNIEQRNDDDLIVPFSNGPEGRAFPVNDQPGKIPKSVGGQVERIRQNFPESWLWQSATAGDDGHATLSTTVPDTITSWIASAFASNLLTGLGVAPTTAKLTVFRPFFVSLTFPSSLTKGEQAVIQATVFNYLPAYANNVEVTLRGSDMFKFVQVQADGSETLVDGNITQYVNVRSNEQGVVFFPIQTTDIGVIKVIVTARSPNAGDGVERVIIVEPEGAPVSFNNPVFVSLEEGNTLMQPVTFSLPPSAVSGSEKTRVKVTGDLIGSSLNNLASLLELPTGCGEQSIAKFAPDLYIAQYLIATNKMTQNLRGRITYLLETGYQRQLTYRRFDGSFSAFGNFDETGSTMLTSLVARVFSEARDLIYIDPQVIYRAIDWLVYRQHNDGHFEELGKVLDANTPLTGNSPALTAFALLTLNEGLSKLSPVDERYRYDLWTYAAGNATRHLENALREDAITDTLSMAIVSYALQQSGSDAADVALGLLESLSTVEGGLKYWSATSGQAGAADSSTFLSWRPPKVQSRATDIMATSYAILANVQGSSGVSDLLPAVQWLVSQRNAQGGFASTQDTTVGLQALSAFATLLNISNTNLDIHISPGNGLNNINFVVNSSNSLTLQIQEIDDVPPTIDVHATGNGFAMVEFESQFHVSAELSTPSFDVSPVLLDDDIDSFNLMICTRWLWDRETGMVVQEISIPSGFTPDLSSLGQVAGLMRSERKGDTVAVYFDQVSKTSLCYSLLMTRSSKVARSQPAYIRTFDYYQPSDQSTVFYEPKKLKEATVCDVCDRCTGC